MEVMELGSKDVTVEEVILVGTHKRKPRGEEDDDVEWEATWRG